ncbi:hypothetical protein MBGDC06_00625, partial [Thermoplasmatales archaeon SCGC AB-539-C06]
ADQLDGNIVITLGKTEKKRQFE